MLAADRLSVGERVQARPPSRAKRQPKAIAAEDEAAEGIGAALAGLDDALQAFVRASSECGWLLAAAQVEAEGHGQVGGYRPGARGAVIAIGRRMHAELSEAVDKVIAGRVDQERHVSWTLEDRPKRETAKAEAIAEAEQRKSRFEGMSRAREPEPAGQ